MKDRLVPLAEERFGRRPDAIMDLAADGSTRQYFRLVWDNERTVIGGWGPDADENRAFLAFARAFRGIALPVPEIYADDGDVWLEEDLGDTTLFKARSAADEFPMELYQRVLAVLPRFQVEGYRVIDFDLAYPRQAFDEQSIRWDLNYFKYHFLKLAHIPFNEQKLEDDFARLTSYLLAVPADTFMYRDFQSRNVMIRDGEPWFIDFQGGRKGARHYDVASLLYDAKAAIPPATREVLLDYYIEQAGITSRTFKREFTGFVLIRLMQAMGAYGYRGFFERKRRFLESVPHAARNLEYLLGAGLPLAMPELEAVFRKIVERWATPEGRRAHSTLNVLVRSFSYRDGIPADSEGHGGGYVFDCRAVPNPHFVPELKDLSGRDEPVADYLERQPEAQEFWSNVSGLVDQHVEKYLERGKTNLTVAFGCTGGQHRSVYFAIKLVSHLAKYPQVAVRLVHGRP